MGCFQRERLGSKKNAKHAMKHRKEQFLWWIWCMDDGPCTGKTRLRSGGKLAGGSANPLFYDKMFPRKSLIPPRLSHMSNRILQKNWHEHAHSDKLSGSWRKNNDLFMAGNLWDSFAQLLRQKRARNHQSIKNVQTNDQRPKSTSKKPQKNRFKATPLAYFRTNKCDTYQFTSLL